MKKLLLLVVLAVIGVAAWYYFETRPKPDVEVRKQQPVSQSKYSAAFNVSVQNMLRSYYNLSEALVKWDSAAVNSSARELNERLGAMQFEELQKDTLIMETAGSYVASAQKLSASIGQEGNLTEKRRQFHSLSQNIYDLLRSIRYDADKVYLQECPMAFNDNETAIWLSYSDSIRNPYLGLHHPKYKSGMLECGETKDSLTYGNGQ